MSLPLSSSLLSGPEALGHFAARYAQLAGVPVDLSYLSRARVRAFYDSSGHMIGGYVINDHAPFRYLSALPVAPHVLLGDKLADTRECCCIWMEPGLSQWLRIGIYLRVLVDLSSGGKRYFLGGSLHPGVVRVQRYGLPHMLYEGPAGNDEHRFHAWVYYGTRSTMWRGAFRRLGPRILRALSRRPRPVFKAVVSSDAPQC